MTEVVSGRIRNVKNLGPAMERMLKEIDIPDREALERIGPVDAYFWLKFRFGSNVNIVALYAMAAGLQDRDWRSLTAEERSVLKAEVTD
jgi:DNA transformation protein